MTAKRKTTTKAKPKAAAKGNAAAEGLREAFRALRDAIVRDLGRSPPRDARQSALQDAWRIALKDRIPRVRRRLEDLLKARRWDLSGGGAPRALHPSHWRHVVRQGLGDVAVTLAGARRQYETIGLRWRERMRLGAVRGRNAPAAATKALEKQRKDAEKKLQDEREQERQRYRETLERVLEGWALVREEIAAHLHTLQELTARLQDAEERRLDGLLRQAPPEVAARARGPLQKARGQRLDGAALLLDDPREAGKWSSLLRQWNLSRERAARALA
jgi:hypothetical protein